MDVFERRAIIEERVTDHGEVQFADLAREFGVSEMTIRRDIEVLQSAGIVRRVSGGAIALPGTAFEPSYGSRAGHAVDSKMHIAVAIVEKLTGQAPSASEASAAVDQALSRV